MLSLTEAARVWPSAEASPAQISEKGDVIRAASHRHTKCLWWKSCWLNYLLSFRVDGMKISRKYWKVLERHVA